MEGARFTAREKADEAMREVGHRRRVYARLVERGAMPQRKADRLIALMEEVAAEYREQAEAVEKMERLL